MDNPIIGVGYGNFEGQYGSYQAKYFANNPHNSQVAEMADIVRYPYNIFLQILCEQGVIGLTLFLLLLLLIIHLAVNSVKHKNKFKLFLSLATFSSIISICVCGQTSYPFDIIPVYIIFFISLSIFIGINVNNSSIVILKAKATTVAISSMIILGCYFLVLSNQKFSAYKRWRYLSFNSMDSYAISNIYPILQGDIDFLHFYSKALLKDGEYLKGIAIMENSKKLLAYPELHLTLAQLYDGAGQYKNAESSFKTACNMVPNRFHSKYLKAKFYYHNKQFIKAAETAKQILNMKVKIPSKTIDKIKADTEILLLQSQKQL